MTAPLGPDAAIAEKQDIASTELHDTARRHGADPQKLL
jgi:hypothetical protein